MPQLRWFVTGCSSGLGSALVLSILKRGDKVVASTRGDSSRISSLKEAGAETISLDVTASPSYIHDAVRKVLENGPIDVLVNNAGYIEAGLAEEASYDSYLTQFETNFFGVIKTTQAILPHMRKRRSGAIVFIGSSGGIGGEPGAGPYCGTKFALEGWHDCLKQEIAHLGIKCIIFELGFFRTKMMDPANVKFCPNDIPDYNGVRNAVEQFVQGMNGNQPGDPRKAAEIILDIVREEGVAEGKALPARLPLGPDCLVTLRKRAVDNLAICNDWEDVIQSTNLDQGIELPPH